MNKVNKFIVLFSVFLIFLKLSLAADDDCGVITTNLIVDEPKVITGNCYVIGSDNLVLDGNNQLIQGDSTGVAILNPNGFDNIQIKNFRIKNFKSGIEFRGSQNAQIISNIIDIPGDGGFGIKLDDSPGAVVKDNSIITLFQGGAGIYLIGSAIEGYSDGSEILNNNIESKGPDTNGIHIKLCTGCKANNNEIISRGVASSAILFISVKDSEIRNNDISVSFEDSSGIKLALGSFRNTIKNNDISILRGYAKGISLEGTGFNQNEPKENIVDSNTILSEVKSIGLFLRYASGNNLSNNQITLNSDAENIGIEINNAHNNLFLGNELIFSVSGNYISMAGSAEESVSGEGNRFEDMICGDTSFSSGSIAHVTIGKQDESSKEFSEFDGINAGGYLLISSTHNSGGYADITYTYKEDINLDERTVAVYRFDETLQIWTKLEGAFVDEVNRIISPGMIRFPFYGEDRAYIAAFGNPLDLSESDLDDSKIDSFNSSLVMNNTNIISDGNASEENIKKNLSILGLSRNISESDEKKDNYTNIILIAIIAVFLVLAILFTRNSRNKVVQESIVGYEPLIEYVKGLREKGISDELIENKLKGAGWNETERKKIFRIVPK